MAINYALSFTFLKNELKGVIAIVQIKNNKAEASCPSRG